MRRIAVTALSDGWRVSLDNIANDMVFRSGREAERAARKLAARLTQAGVRCEIRLHLKDGTLAGKFLCPAVLPARANDNTEAAASRKRASAHAETAVN
jgi:hypothetical protein